MLPLRIASLFTCVALPAGAETWGDTALEPATAAALSAVGGVETVCRADIFAGHVAAEGALRPTEGPDYLFLGPDLPGPTVQIGGGNDPPQYAIHRKEPT